jgi:hypothetical protein
MSLSSAMLINPSGSRSSPGSWYLREIAPSTFSAREKTKSAYLQETGTDSKNVSPPTYFHTPGSFCRRNKEIHSAGLILGILLE